MEYWEYLTRKLDFAEAEEASTYNTMSAQGWELVSTHAARRRGVLTNPDVLTHVVAIFRRRTGLEYLTLAPDDA